MQLRILSRIVNQLPSILDKAGYTKEEALYMMDEAVLEYIGAPIQFTIITFPRVAIKENSGLNLRFDAEGESIYW